MCCWPATHRITFSMRLSISPRVTGAGRHRGSWPTEALLLLALDGGRVRVARVILLRGVCPPNVTFHPLSDPSPFELAALQSGKGRASIASAIRSCRTRSPRSLGRSFLFDQSIRLPDESEDRLARAADVADRKSNAHAPRPVRLKIPERRS